jgi:hypothetical protein
MTVVTAPSLIPGLPQAVAPRFNPGEFIVATVLSMLDASTVRLQLPNGTANFPAGQSFAPGTRVEVNIGGTAANPSVTITPLPADMAPTRPMQAPTSNVSTPQQLAASIVGDAAARQNGLAPLYADLAALAQRGVPLPAPVIAVARQLLDAPIDLASKTTVSAAEIKSALMQSGLVATTAAAMSPTAAALTAAATATPAAPPAQLAGLTLLLGLLRRSLTNWTEAEQVDAPQADVTMAAARATLAPAADAGQTPRAAAPPPPFRNGPTVSQPVAQATLPEEISGPALAQHLLDRTEAAIARQTLLQVASLPDADPVAAKSGTEVRHLIFDVPLATPQGVTVAQFRIEQDESRRDGETSKPAWRASFAIDIEPIGRVQAHIALMGDRTAVTLRAERPESAALLNDNVGQLEASLREADLEPGTLACVNGAASAAPTAAAPGLFLDSTT